MNQEKIMNLIAEQLDADLETMTLETNLIEDLGADSLDIADLVMELEEQLEVEISDDDLATLKTVGDIVTYIDKL